MTGRPNLSEQESGLIDRSLNGAHGWALLPHRPLQTFDRIRCKVPLARPDVDPGRHVLNQQKPPIDPDVVGHALFDQCFGWW